jgi:tyrosyl-tRNA synthetase
LNCQLQTGGSDQWGNITAGVELIRRIKGQTAYGMVYPLITKADGTKFGKTETGTIWLSAKRTSPYKFFQFWLNTDDRDVVNYLKFFTWLNETEITELENELATKPEQRAAQRRLAREMTRRLHDESGLQKAEQAAQVLFGGELTGLSTTEIEEIFEDVPSSSLNKSFLEGTGTNILDILSTVGVTKSKGDARRSVEEGGIYLNNQRVIDARQQITLSDSIGGNFLILRKGRKNFTLVKIT